MRGHCRVEQDGRVTELSAGDMAFQDSTRPYTLRFDAPFHQLVVRVPLREPALRSSRDLTARTLGPGTPGPVTTAFFGPLDETEVPPRCGVCRQQRCHSRSDGSHERTVTMAAPRKYSLEWCERAVRMCHTIEPKPQIKITAPAPNRLWVTDLKMLSTVEGPSWLSAIRHAFSRRWWPGGPRRGRTPTWS
ncbi:hypothetical protein [Streptomyces sp. NPDC059895]|uniref:AraC-like ligand-binding domain-containing protein n=1 Tax=Streptomyces sp. NPDC059895 TaxID=3346992 RepID=UPI00365C1012